jgi:MOSC domain-containing protein YiiM
MATSSLPASGSVRGVFTGPVRSLRSPRQPGAAATAWRSAILKSPASGPVAVGPLGLAGDAQKERRFHGGPTKAVLVYAAAHYADWQPVLAAHAAEHADALRAMSRDVDASAVGFGAFGENIVVDGLDEHTVFLGDVWQMGTCRLQITEPRGPCGTLTRRWMRPELLAEVRASSRAGWYNAVSESGSVAFGDAVTLVSRTQDEWSIARLFQLIERRTVARRDVQALLESPAITDALRERFERRLATPGRVHG